MAKVIKKRETSKNLMIFYPQIRNYAPNMIQKRK